MSIIPIGTVFPAVAPSALVRVGIPTGDGFYMNEGSVPLESITPTSGTWTPTVSDIAGAATVEILGISTYQRIGNLITDTCRIIVQFDAGQSTDTFNLDLAIPPAANFINARQVTAIYSITSSIPEVDAINIQSLAASKLTAIPITGNGTALLITFVCQRTYQYTV
jgi:hypothetical protein